MRRALLGLFRRISAIYFREIEIVGNVPAPDTRGRIFAPNHTNGLIDPILVLTNAPCAISPLAKSTLWQIPVLRWLLDAVGAVPVRRRKDDPTMKTEANDALFATVAERLKVGGNVLIFPEGISHTEPQVQKLRTGAGRMLSRARAEGATGLSVQAVGLEFDARDTFRSRALVVYGPVRDVDALAATHGEEDLVKVVTAQLAEDLAELVVEGATWEEHLLIARVAEMFANDQGDRSLRAWNEIGRQVEAARKALGPDDASLYREIALAVGGYFAALAASGFTDHEVAAAEAPRPRRTFRRLILAAALPLAVPGAVLYWVPYQIPRFVVRRIPAEERDVISTKKLATGIVAFPVWAGLLTAASWVALPAPLAAVATGVVLVSPFAALVWLDHLDQLRLGRGRARPEDIARLRAVRRDVMDLLARARAKVDGAATAAAATG
jgi:1-acyl-sn-glycerol-3-phosphate acyltransferase